MGELIDDCEGHNDQDIQMKCVGRDEWLVAEWSEALDSTTLEQEHKDKIKALFRTDAAEEREPYLYIDKKGKEVHITWGYLQNGEEQEEGNKDEKCAESSVE